jgi:hypothetical protein
MLTNYWYKIQDSICSGAVFSGKTFNGTEDNRYTIKYGSYDTSVGKYTKLGLGTLYTDKNKGYSPVIVVGASDTPETKEDYTLDDLTPQLTHISNAYHCGVTENGIEHTFVRVLKNATSENIVIREIGLIRQTMIDFSSDAYPFLVMRKVLPTPMLFISGATITITIVISEGAEDVSVS